jgi:hypothetical protein
MSSRLACPDDPMAGVGAKPSLAIDILSDELRKGKGVLVKSSSLRLPPLKSSPLLATAHFPRT